MKGTFKIKKKTFYISMIVLAVIAIIIILIAVSSAPKTPKKDFSVFNDGSLYPSLGPENANHTIIEFADFQCPWCAVASGFPEWAYVIAKNNSNVASMLDSAGKIEKMAENGQVRFIYVPMAFLGDESENAAEAALCANEQGKFWQMHDALFTANDGKENDGTFTKDKLEAIAQGITGLDIPSFNNCLESGSTLLQVRQITSVAGNYVQGTPAFFVDGKQVSGTWASLQAALGQ